MLKYPTLMALIILAIIGILNIPINTQQGAFGYHFVWWPVYEIQGYPTGPQKLRWLDTLYWENKNGQIIYYNPHPGYHDPYADNG